MKKIFLILTLGFVLIGYAPSAHAQSSAAIEENEKAIFALEAQIVKLCGMIVDFAAIKSDLYSKQEDGTLIYNVKNCDMMLAKEQYVIIKPNGNAFYIAIYGGDSKKLQISSGTFKLVRSPFKSELDNIKTKGDEVVHSLLFQGSKLGSYMLNEKKGEGRMILGLQ